MMVRPLSPPGGRELWGLVALLALAGLLYWLGVDGPFLFDDFNTFVLRPEMRISDARPETLWQAAWSDASGPTRRPVAILSFVLTYLVAGAEAAPVWFKSVNVVLHLAATLLVYLLAQELVRGWRGEAPGAEASVASRRIALLAAALWGLHPLHVSTVLYAVQRMAELAALFVFAAAWLYARARRRMATGETRGLAAHALGVALCGVLALLSKENGVLLPLLLLEVEVTLYRFRFFGRVGWGRAITALLVLPSLMVVAYLAWGVWQAPLGSPVREFTLVERLLTEARVVWHYLGLLLLPEVTRMGLFYGDYEVSRGWLTPLTTLPAVVGVAGLALLGWWSRRRRPALAFGLLWFLVGHLLESTVVQLELVFEHRNYLPALGPAVAVAWYLGHPRLREVARPTLQRLFVVAPVVALAVALAIRADAWGSRPEFLAWQVENHPSDPRVWGTVGFELGLRGAYEEANEAFRQAAELDDHEVGYLLGQLLGYWSMGEAWPEPLLREIEVRLSRYPISSYGSGLIVSLGRDRNIPAAQRLRLLNAATASELWRESDQRAMAYWLSFLIYRAQGDDVSARQARRRVHELAPKGAELLEHSLRQAGARDLPVRDTPG